MAIAAAGCMDSLVSGECASPMVACGPYCVDLENDPSNCGACGAVCDGTCTAGVCYAEQLGPDAGPGDDGASNGDGGVVGDDGGVIGDDGGSNSSDGGVVGDDGGLVGDDGGSNSSDGGVIGDGGSNGD